MFRKILGIVELVFINGENAKAEIEKKNDVKAVSQKMFKVV